MSSKRRYPLCGLWKSRNLLSIRALILVCVLFGCDSNDPGFDTDPGSYEGPGPVAGRTLSTLPAVSVGNSTHIVTLDSLGRISKGSWSPGSSEIESLHHIYASGIVMYADLDRPRANATNMNYSSNYRIAETENGSAGIYVLSADSLLPTVDNWPVDLGAPATLDGQPRLMGDMMAWARYSAYDSDDLRPTFAAPILTDPILGLDLGMTIYLYDTFQSQNILFIRFDLINTTNESINDLIVGYQVDTDFDVRYFDRARCYGDGDAGNNATGYVEELALSYTYFQADSTSSALPPDCFGKVVGYTFIQTPLTGNASEQVLAHTILRKNIRLGYPGFGEMDYTEPRHLGLALNGFSTAGDPMVDPTTGQETKFAFTGDPVTGSGWLDTPEDIRSMLSLQPFTIPSGETESITLAWIAVAEDSLEAGINELKRRAASIRNGADLLTY